MLPVQLPFLAMMFSINFSVHKKNPNTVYKIAMQRSKVAPRSSKLDLYINVLSSPMCLYMRKIYTENTIIVSFTYVDNIEYMSIRTRHH